MVRMVLSSMLCLLGVFGDDEASLLQANAGKKRIHAHSIAQWVEEFAQNPNEVVTRVSSMPPAEQDSLRELFASSDASTLAKEIEPHKEKLALALRGSVQTSVLQWLKVHPVQVAALQQRSDALESVISSKADQIRKKNDGLNSTSFPSSFDFKEQTYTLAGGRCRNGMEYDDIDFEAACIAMCDADETCTVSVVEAGGLDVNSTEPDVCKRSGDDHNDFATGEGLNEADTCADLCNMDDLCTSSDFEEGVCKRFTESMKSYKRKTLRACAKACTKKEECLSFEWDNGECELHDNSTSADLSAAEAIGDDHACYMKA